MTEADFEKFDRLLGSLEKDGAPARSVGVALNRLLSDDESARQAWIDHCLMDAMLSSDDALAKVIAEQQLPKNVVVLPGQAHRSHCVATKLKAATQPNPIRGTWRAVAAVLVVLVAITILALRGSVGFDAGPAAVVEVIPDPTVSDRPAAPSAAVDQAVESAPSDDGEAARRSDYEKMLLAEIKPGSLRRPPTPFVSTVAASAAAAGPAQRVSFNRDIRPILSDNCVECHGPDGAARKADLRLDREQDAIAELVAFQSGESAAPIVRGHPELSELIARIETTDVDDLMPPPDSHKVLTNQQIALLKRWVEEGAPWEEHWAFVAPTASMPANNDWAVNAIDRFVFERLQQATLQPAPMADRNTLMRRVTLDLTGLPPTPAEVDAFVSDPSGTDTALEKVVDRLLASPAYGEHRARYWLDAARYADTHGLHLDNYREMWPYRDWVISAYNDNQPFDQFTVEQLAGDLLENPSQAQLVATGFNRCNVTTSEGGAIKEEFEVRYAIDRVSTTSTVWLGLTTGCAQCHDHKYDPISIREFYQLFAYFNNTSQAAMDGNVPDTPPVIRVYPSSKEKSEEQKLNLAKQAAENKMATARTASEAAFGSWQTELKPETVNAELAETSPLGRSVYVSSEQLPTTNSVGGFEIEEDQPFTLVAQVTIPEGKDVFFPLASQIDAQGRGFAFGLDLGNRGIELDLFGKGGASGEGGVLKLSQIHSYKPGAKMQITVRSDGSRNPKGTSVFVNDREMARSRYPYLERDNLNDTFSVADGTAIKVQARPPVLSELQVFDRSLTNAEINSLRAVGQLTAIVNKPVESRSAADTEKLRQHFLITSVGDYQSGLDELAKVELALNAFHNRVPVTHVMHENEAAPIAHMLNRGEYDQPLEQVAPGVPAALPAMPVDAQQNRLGLARWLVDGEHPLTSRVMVNRLWQQLFGTGLVKTSDDFGTQGEPPSHPELLDWLAVDFVASGWDVKHVLKQMVMSATYRQSSRVSPELLDKDPHNRLLARGPRFRLDAEVIRDQALAASGLLSDEIGGPGVRPYQPGGLWSAVGYTNSNTVKFARQYGDSLYRRSVYTFWKRTAPPANLTAFDAPNRESCTVRRERTNTPLQALVLMNDVQFVEAARHLAEHGMQSGQGSVALDTMSRRLLGRSLDSAEQAIIKESLQAFRQTYTSDLDAAKQLLSHGDRASDPHHDPAELAALTMVANQLLNLDEAVTKN